MGATWSMCGRRARRTTARSWLIQATDTANAIVVDDSKTAIDWAGECGLRGVLVQRRAGEPFQDSVLRAFDEVNALL
jgi:hypothetical protein